MDEETLIFGRNVYNFRSNSNLTQKELAGMMQLGKSRVSEIERCLCSPRLSTIAKVSKALRVYPSQLFDKDPDLTSRNQKVNCTKTIYRLVSKEILDIAESKGYTKQQLADLAGVKLPRIYEIQANTFDFRVSYIMRFLKPLEWDFKDFLMMVDL